MTGELQPTGVDVSAPQGPASPDIERVSRPGLRVAFLTDPTGVELYVGDGQSSMMMVSSVDTADSSDRAVLADVWVGFVWRGHFELVPEAHLESLAAYSDAINNAYSGGTIGEVDQGWVLDPAQTDGEKLFPESPHNFVLVPSKRQGAEEVWRRLEATPGFNEEMSQAIEEINEARGILSLDIAPEIPPRE